MASTLLITNPGSRSGDGELVTETPIGCKVMPACRSSYAVR